MAGAERRNDLRRLGRPAVFELAAPNEEIAKTASRTPDRLSLRTALRRVAAVVALLFGLAIFAAPAAGSGTCKPQFYTDEFHFDFLNDDLTANCGFPVRQTFNGCVHGWTRLKADGSVAESVQIKFYGVYYTDQAVVPGRPTFASPNSSCRTRRTP